MARIFKFPFEVIAKLHLASNLRFFRWIRFFAKCLWPKGYVTLRKIEPTKKSLNLAREASFAITSVIFLYPAYLFSVTTLNVTTLTDTTDYTGSGSGTGGDLRWCLNYVNANPDSYDIRFPGLSGTITLNHMLPVVNLFNGNTVSINTTVPQGITIDGQGLYKGLIIRQGNVTLENITFSNCFARGGDGGQYAGGGGMGAGSAVFIDAANVTLYNVQFTNCKAQGGSGGVANPLGGLNDPNAGGGGGGGGLGGNGGIGYAAVFSGNSAAGGGGGIGDYGLNGKGGNGGSTSYTGTATHNGGGNGGGGGIQGNGGDGGNGNSNTKGSGGGGGGGGVYTEGGFGGNATTNNGNNGLGLTITFSGTLSSKFGGGGGAASYSGNKGGSGGNGSTGGKDKSGGGGGVNQAYSTDTSGLSGNAGGGGGGGSYDKTGNDTTYGAGGNGGAGGGGGGKAGGSLGSKVNSGGSGGWGGGAGGGGSTSSVGQGGFGGGGAGAGYYMLGGPGGFGGGGGGGGFSGVAPPGTGGFGGGVGGYCGETTITTGTGIGGGFSRGGGGGGAAFGGAIFVNTGSLTFAGQGLNMDQPVSAVVGGAGGAGSGSALAGFAGYAAGESIFALQNLTFSPDSSLSNMFTVSGSIADGSLASVPATGTSTPGTRSGIQLIKNNAGHLILEGINTYSGGTVINQGPVILQGANGQLLPTGFVDITASGGDAYFDISSSGLSNQVIGDLRGGSDGVIILGTNQLTFGTDNTTAQTYAGTIRLSGTLFKQGTGTEIFSGNSVYFTGGVTISAGTLQLQGLSSCLPSGSVSIIGGTFAVASNQSIQDLTGASGTFISLSSGAQLSFGTGNSTVVASTISGGGSLRKTGAGVVTLSGTNSYSGGTALNQGTLSINADAALGASGRALSVTGSSTLQLSSATISNMNRPISIADGATFTIDTNGFNLTESGVISSNTGALTKIGGGSLILTGPSTYGGATTISGGTLSLQGSSSCIPNSSSISIASGATFAITTNQTVRDITGSSGSFITLGGQLTFGTSNPSTIDSTISGSGSLNKTGTGAATLTGTNTYGGGTVLNQGTLVINSDAALGTAGTALSVTGSSTLQLVTASIPGMNRLIPISDGATFTINTNGLNLNEAGVISSGSANTGALVKSGAGILTLTGHNTYGGGTTISGGELSLQGSGILAPTGFVSVASGATFDISLGSVSPQIIGDLNGAGSVTLGPNALQFGTNNPIAQVFSGVISDGALGGSMIKTGTGAAIFSGANTYTGGTVLNAGSLQINTDASLGAAGTALSVTGSSTLQLGGTILTMNRPMSIADGVTFTIDTNGYDLTNAGALSSGFANTGSLTKISSGILTLSGANTYGGGTNIQGGTLQLGVGGSLFSSGPVFVGSGATFDISPGGPLTQTIGDLTGSGSVTLGQNTLQFGTNNSVSQTFSGVISDASLGGSIIKAGSGTAILTGNSSYTGPTTLSNGTLKIGQNTSIGASGTPLYATGNNVTLNIGYSGVMDHPITITAGDQLIVQVDGSLAPTITAAISETAASGLLQKLGTGELILSAASSYTGQTTISGGTLTLSGGSNCIPNSALVSIGVGAILNIASSQTIQELTGVSGSFVTLQPSIDLSFTGTGVSTVFAGVISGSGSMTKTSPNLAVFTGANTYSGGTTISGGKLSLQGPQGRLNPSGAVNVASGIFDISLSGRPLQIIGDLTGSGSVTLGSKTLEFGTSTPLVTFGGVISGSGEVIKQGSGTAVFTGVNTYTGGTVIVRGTLSLGLGGSLDASSPVTVGIFPLVFSPVFDISAGGNQVIGDLTGTGTATVNLGANTLTFGTNNSKTQTFKGSVQGPGFLTKQGSGAAVFTGTSSFSGGTDVQAGTFVVDGSFTSALNNIAVQSGATFGGIGSIAGTLTVNNNATLHPGNPLSAPSVGTLTLGGLTLSPSSNTYIVLQPQSATQSTSASEIIVNGTAVIDGTLTLYGIPGFYPETATYTLISATALSPHQPFTSVVIAPGSQNLGTYTVLYDYFSSPQTVVLSLSNIPPPLININLIHCGPNPEHVAEYLNRFNTSPVLGPIVFDLSILSPQELCRALNNISPARNATGAFVSQNTMFLIASTVSNRMSQQRLMMRDMQMHKKDLPKGIFADLPSPKKFLEANPVHNAGLPTQPSLDSFQKMRTFWGSDLKEEELIADSGETKKIPIPHGKTSNVASGGQQYALWGEALGEWISQQPGRGNPGYSSYTGGGLFGVDYYGEENGLMGAALCYAKSRVYQNYDAGENTVDYYAGTIYGTAYIGDGYIEIGLAGAYNDFSNLRRIQFPESSGDYFNKTAKSSYWGAQIVPHLGGGADWNFDWVTLEPFGTLDCDVLYRTAFSETEASPLNMEQTSSWSELLRLELGLHAYELWTTKVGDFILRETLSYVNKQPFHIGKINANIVGFPPGFTVDSFNNNQNFISPSFQFLYRGPKGTFFSASYMGEFQWGYGAYTSNSLLVQLGAYF